MVCSSRLLSVLKRSSSNRISSVRLSSALTSLNFTNHADDNWCASIGKVDGEPRLRENYWTGNQHYVCQYDCE